MSMNYSQVITDLNLFLCTTHLKLKKSGTVFSNESLFQNISPPFRRVHPEKLEDILKSPQICFQFPKIRQYLC